MLYSVRQVSVSCRAASVSGANTVVVRDKPESLTTLSLALTSRVRNWPASESCCTGSQSSPGLWGETPEAADLLLGLCAPARGGSDLHRPKYGLPRLRARPRWTTTPRVWSIC